MLGPTSTCAINTAEGKRRLFTYFFIFFIAGLKLIERGTETNKQTNKHTNKTSAKQVNNLQNKPVTF